jgi:acetoacetyl-CoA reductase
VCLRKGGRHGHRRDARHRPRDLDGAEGCRIQGRGTYAGNEAQRFKSDTRVPVFKFDVADFNAYAEGVKAIEAALGGPVDVLVNNAGITRDATMHRMRADQWNDVVRTILDSCFNMARAVIEGMRGRGFGRIVNISSINGQAGQIGQTNYAAAKAGILGFTKALAQEGAARGVTVNAVAPGYVETEMVRAVPANVLEQIVARIPVGRLGQPEEIARAVLFLIEGMRGRLSRGAICSGLAGKAETAVGDREYLTIR